MKVKDLTKLSVEEIVAKVEENALVHTDAPIVIPESAMATGKMWPQGDVNVTCVAAIPEGYQKGKPGVREQVAHGNTQGSRHIAVGAFKIYWPEDGGNALAGPVIESDKPWTLEHPEHANVTFPPGRYKCDYQRDYEREEIERVRD